MPESFSHYTLLGPLGSGGMGVVHRAHDTHLGRDVALKLLPPGLFTDEIARARLVREARLAATLNHPHICTIYEVGEVDSQPYIAMELISGSSLREQIPPAGLPVETVLRYGIAVSDALAHAHQHGIVHRDLKSSNVAITSEGRVKVLDFGVACRAWSGVEGETLEMLPALTGTGTIVGTPACLAPEVWRGEKAGTAADIWALGVMLSELLTGRMPFQGRTLHELSAAILSDPPAPLPARVPAALRAVILRCLEKDPVRRFQGAGEVRASLETLLAGTGVPSHKMGVGLRGRLLWGSATLLVLIGGSAWLAWKQPWRHRELEQRQLISNGEEDPTYNGVISPDGKLLADVEGGGISLREIDSGDTHPLSLPAGITLRGAFPRISWFPDGRQLLVSVDLGESTPGIWSIPVLGGRPARILDWGGLAAISPDGKSIAFANQTRAGIEIWRMGPGGESPVRILPADSTRALAIPVWSPGGSRLAFVHGVIGPHGPESRIETSDLEGHRRLAIASTQEQRIHPLSGVAWLPDGRLVFGLSDPAPGQRDMNLWSLHVDPSTGAPSGKPRRITRWQRASLLSPIQASADGRRLSVGILEYQSDCYIARIAAGDSALQEVRRLTRDVRMDLGPQWTSDGRAVLFESDRGGDFDIYEQATDATVADPVVGGPGDQAGALVSPDGAWLMFVESAPDKSAGLRLMRRSMGGGPVQQVLELPRGGGYTCSRGTGGLCVLGEGSGSETVFTEFDPLHGRGRELARIVAGKSPSWDLSPDGRWLAVVDNRDTLPRIELLPVGGGERREVKLERRLYVANIAWAPRGESWFLVVASRDAWNLVRADSRGRIRQLLPPQFWMYSAAVSPDGRHIAYTSNTGQGSVWMLENP